MNWFFCLPKFPSYSRLFSFPANGYVHGFFSSLSFPKEAPPAKVQFNISAVTSSCERQGKFGHLSLRPGLWNIVPSVITGPTPLIPWDKGRRELKLCICVLIHSEPMKLLFYQVLEFLNCSICILSCPYIYFCPCWGDLLSCSRKVERPLLWALPQGGGQHATPQAPWSIWTLELGGKYWCLERGFLRNSRKQHPCLASGIN